MLTEQTIVRLKRKISTAKLQERDYGTILAVYDTTPPAYEVEFCDSTGKSIALLTLNDDEIVEKGIVEISEPNFLLAFHISDELEVDYAGGIPLCIEIHINTFSGITYHWVSIQNLVEFQQKLFEMLIEDSRLQLTYVQLCAYSPGEFELNLKRHQNIAPSWNLNIKLSQGTSWMGSRYEGFTEIEELTLRQLLLGIKELCKKVEELYVKKFRDCN
jgi:hypothetical protein